MAQFAVASPFPGCRPQGIGCEDEPAIAQIGYLDVDPNYLDPATGFAVRMNKDPGGDVPSTAPFQGFLPLFGCAPEAQFYRVMASYADSSGLVFDSSGSVVPLLAGAFGPALPVIGPAWQVSRIVGGMPELCWGDRPRCRRLVFDRVPVLGPPEPPGELEPDRRC